MKLRSVHRPISIRVETISPLPDVRVLPVDTEMTVNLKLDQKKAKELAMFLLKEILVDTPLELIAVTITGVNG